MIEEQEVQSEMTNAQKYRFNQSFEKHNLIQLSLVPSLLMSESDFEDLTSSIHSSHLLQELNDKKWRILELTAQVSDLNQNIEKMKKIQSYLKDQLLKKNDLINKMTIDSVRLSNKILQKQEQCISFKEQIIETQKSYQQALQQSLNYKSELIELNKELSDQLVKRQEMINSTVIELNRSQQTRHNLSQSFRQVQIKLEDRSKKLVMLESENQRMRSILEMNEKELLQKQMIREKQNKEAQEKFMRKQEQTTIIKVQSQLLKEQKRNLLNQLTETKTYLQKQRAETNQLKIVIEQKYQQHHKNLQLISQLENQCSMLKKINFEQGNQRDILCVEMSKIKSSYEQQLRTNSQLKSQSLEKQTQLLGLRVTLQKITSEFETIRVQADHAIKNSNELSNHRLDSQQKRQKKIKESENSQLTQLRRKCQKLERQLKQYEQIIQLIQQDSEDYRKQIKQLKIANNQLTAKCVNLQQQLDNKQIELHQFLKQYENSLSHPEKSKINNLRESKQNDTCSQQFVLIKIKELVAQIKKNISVCIFEEEERKITETKERQTLLESIRLILLPNKDQVKQIIEPMHKASLKKQRKASKSFNNLSTYFKNHNPFE